MRRLLILGAGGHGEVVGEIAFLMKKWDEIAFLDDDENKKECLSFNVIGNLNDLTRYSSDYDEIFVAIGNNHVRKELCKKLRSNQTQMPVLIHPSAVVSSYSTIGAGSVIMANAIINPNCKIGEGCIINTASSVDHDCIINDFVHISPGCHLSGSVIVEEEVWLGTGTCIKNNIHIFENTVCGVGCVVIKDVPANTKVVGNPANKITSDKEKAYVQ